MAKRYPKLGARPDRDDPLRIEFRCDQCGTRVRDSGWRFDRFLILAIGGVLVQSCGCDATHSTIGVQSDV